MHHPWTQNDAQVDNFNFDLNYCFCKKLRIYAFIKSAKLLEMNVLIINRNKFNYEFECINITKNFYLFMITAIKIQVNSDYV